MAGLGDAAWLPVPNRRLVARHLLLGPDRLKLTSGLMHLLGIRRLHLVPTALLHKAEYPLLVLMATAVQVDIDLS
jgi:hypothetical protein